MSRKKRRSKFWVVTTHVITTGVAIPFLTYLGFLLFVTPFGKYMPALVDMTALGPVLRSEAVLMLGTWLAFMTLGYLGGTIYSLSYLKRVAFIDKPTDCTRPSIIVFAGCALVGIMVNVYVGYMMQLLDQTWALVCALYLVAIVCGFAYLTKRGFEKWESMLEAAGQEEPDSNYRSGELYPSTGCRQCAARDWGEWSAPFGLRGEA